MLWEPPQRRQRRGLTRGKPGGRESGWENPGNRTPQQSPSPCLGCKVPPPPPPPPLLPPPFWVRFAEGRRSRSRLPDPPSLGFPFPTYAFGFSSGVSSGPLTRWPPPDNGRVTAWTRRSRGARLPPPLPTCLCSALSASHVLLIDWEQK